MDLFKPLRQLVRFTGPKFEWRNHLRCLCLKRLDRHRALSTEFYKEKVQIGVFSNYFILMYIDVKIEEL